jgi:WD40 repeat protein
VYGLKWSADGRRIVSAGCDWSIAVWDADNGALIKKVRSNLVQHYQLALSPDGRWAVASGGTGHVALLDLASFDVQSRGPTHYTLNPVRPGFDYGAIAFSPSGKEFALGGAQDPSVWVLDAESEVERARLAGQTATIRGLAWMKDGRLISIGEDGHVHVHWMGPGPADRDCESGFGELHGVTISADGGRALLFNRQAIVLIDVGTGKAVRRWVVADTGFGPCKAAFSPNGRTFAAAGDGGVRVYDQESGEEVGRFGEADSRLRALAYSPDGRRIATGGTDADRAIRVWELRP